MNLAVLVGHSAVRTAVMGDEAGDRKEPDPRRLAEMKRLVGEAMSLARSASAPPIRPNHSGWGGIPMPSTISDIGEFEALVGAMGGPGRGVVEIASGTVPVDTIAGIAGRHGRRIFMTTGLSFYNEQFPERGIGMFEACAAAQRVARRSTSNSPASRCRSISPWRRPTRSTATRPSTRSRPMTATGSKVFPIQSFRDSFRDDLRNPRPGTIFQGNWDRGHRRRAGQGRNAGLANRSIAEIIKGSNRDPLDTFLDLGLDEDLDTGFVGRFLNAVDEGVEPLVKHKAGVIALSDAGAHLVYLCDAGFGLYLLGHWVRERGAFDIVEGVRRLTSHQAGLYGIPDRGRIAVGAYADLMLFDPATVHVSAPRRVNDLPAGGQRTLRDPIGVHGVYVNGTRVFDGSAYAKLTKGPGRVLDRFLPAREAGLASAAQ